ncbi:MAG TPA: 4Fe-4S single cluster domain-containing protein [Spirochaetota bacterium]|nr:4Fe-4S single cluster domain-containing protein [Spirochaetota bacterium]HPN83264.1 4Fe-4S single cluster domain-containing protein [Spirochaetota bacterium]
MLSIHAILTHSRVNGPGDCCVVWLQGCIHDCPGCCNTAACSRTRGEIFLAAEHLADDVIAARPDCLSLSGGEPFLQARELVSVARRVHAAGIGVLAWSGYEYEALRDSRNPWQRELLEELDILVCGPYLRDVPQREIWAGSGNQRTLFFGTRFADWEPRIAGKGHIECTIRGDGSGILTGFGSFSNA